MSESKLIEHDLTTELWREYEMSDGPNRVTYRIDNPVKLVIRAGGATQRVVDAHGVVHNLPGPGFRACVVRWQSRNPSKPVDF